MSRHNYDNVTFTMSLPRCRTAWLTKFLKPVAITMHDPLKNCESIDELGFKIDAFLDHGSSPIFIADTSAFLFFDEISARFLNCRFLFIDRPAEQIRRSMQGAGMPVPSGNFFPMMQDHWHHAKVVSDARNDFVYRVEFGKMNSHLRNIWRFIGADQHLSDDYISQMVAQNIQVPYDVQRANTNDAKVRILLARHLANYRP